MTTDAPETRYHVPTDKHPPLPRWSEQTPEERKKWKADQNRKHRESKGLGTRPVKTLRASILERKDASGAIAYVARVRELDDSKAYLGTYNTREDAQAACDRYIATGERPAPMQRGPKKGSRKRPGSMTRWGTPVLLTDKQAKPLSTAERLARTGGKLPSSPATARKPAGEAPTRRAQLIAKEYADSLTPKEAAELETLQAEARERRNRDAPIGGMTLEQKAARLEMLKAAWRRTA